MAKSPIIFAFLAILTLLGCGVQIRTPITGTSLSIVTTPSPSPAASVPALFRPVGTGLDSNVYQLALDSANRVVVVGAFTHYNGVAMPYAARLNIDGSLDTSFAPTGTGLNNAISAMALDTSGKVVVVGDFTSYNGTPAGHVARLNTDGSLDTSFALTGSGFDNSVYSVAIDSTNKIVVGGIFQNYNGNPAPFVVRLNTDGTMDNTFTPTGSGLDNTVYHVTVDSTHHVIASGLFEHYNGTSAPYVARLNPDGTLDNSFAVTGTGFNNFATRTYLDSSGRIVVIGNFSSYNGTSEPYIARLHSDGSLDTTFVPTGSGLNNFPEIVAFDSSGKIIIGGVFTSYNGTAVPYIARLNTDGSLDNSFQVPGSGPGTLIFYVDIDAQDNIFAGGGFTTVSGISDPFIAKFGSSGSID